MKLFWTVAATLTFGSLWGGVSLTPSPSLAQNALLKAGIVEVDKPPSADQHLPQLVQQPSPTLNPLSQELLQQVAQCLQETISNPQQPITEALQVASMQCVFKVVFLAPDGSVRPDANERLTALVKLTGISLPKPSSQGQATVKLQRLTDSQVLTLPVTIGGQSKTFLFDTGASNSIIDSQIAQQLGLTGTPLPSDLLAYMVVGDNCSKVSATLHELPAIKVNAASVSGMMGLGLPQTSIPGKASGVLGLDFLSSFDVVVNPKTLQLKLLPPSSPTTNAIPLKGRLGVMTTQVMINGRGPFTFLLDTGADAIVISERLAQLLSLNLINAKSTEVVGFCGTTVTQQTKLAQVNLQTFQATNLDAVVLKDGVLKFLGIDGIIGQNFLNQYQQHWRFGQVNELGFPEEGSLSLSPL